LRYATSKARNHGEEFSRAVRAGINEPFFSCHSAVKLTRIFRKKRKERKRERKKDRKKRNVEAFPPEGDALFLFFSFYLKKIFFFERTLLF
jgi:hypothetical protein